MKTRFERQQRGMLDPATLPIDYDAGEELLTYVGSDNKHKYNKMNLCNRNAAKCRWFRDNVCKRTWPNFTMGQTFILRLISSSS
jgi:hypothetical protein